MTSRFAVALMTCALASACSSRDGAPLSVSNIVVPEPLPGTSMTAGYLTIDNNSNQPIAIERITSPQFARVEMHETVLDDDVARMVSLAPLIVDRRSSVRFEPGGKHLMMSQWPQEIAAGLQITIEFHYDGSGLLIVATTVSPRDELPD
jgi:copper(I)-binding protein